MKKTLMALFLSLSVMNAPAVVAQSTPVPSPSVDVKPTILDPVANKRVVDIASQLRCLVCQNQSIADSNAELAVDLKNQVVKQINEGRSDKEIIDYMVERYGDFVLYDPPFKLSTALLWIGPGALLLIALLWLFWTLKSRKQELKTERPLTEEEKKRAEALLAGQVSSTDKRRNK